MKFIIKKDGEYIKMGSDIWKITDAVKITFANDIKLLIPIYTYLVINIKTQEEFLIRQQDVIENGFEFGYLEGV
jgi:hypothetical protein